MNLKSTLIIAFFSTAVLWGCGKKDKNTSATQEPKKQNGAFVEPDQVRAAVDTRFQEKFFEAQTHKSKGDIEKAYKTFLECSELDSKNAAVQYELSRIEAGPLNNLQNALPRAKFAVDSDRENPWYQQNLAEIHKGLGKYDLAIKAYKEVIRLRPDDTDAMFASADLFYNLGKYNEVINLLNQAQQYTGPNEQLYYQRHQLYIEMKDGVKAGLELEKLAEAFPESPHYWGVVAQYYQLNNIPNKAQSALEKMKAADPNNGKVHYQLSEFYAASGDDVKSYEELKLAFQTQDIDIDQKISVLLKYFSLTEFDKSYMPQAYELLAITAQQHPKESKAFAVYGDFLYRDQRDNEAFEKYKTALELDGTKSIIWLQTIEIALSLKKYEDLTSLSSRAVELFPTMAEFYYYNGIGNEQLKRTDKAIESFNNGKDFVVDNDNLIIQFYLHLGSAYNSAGQFQKSDEAFEYVLLLKPDYPVALNNYAYYLAIRKVKLEKAIAMAKKCVTLEPDNATYLDTYAWALFRTGMYSEALVEIKKAVSKTKNGELMEHYGDILFKNGFTSEALDAWKEAASLGGGSTKLNQKIQTQQYID